MSMGFRRVYYGTSGGIFQPGLQSCIMVKQLFPIAILDKYVKNRKIMSHIITISGPRGGSGKSVTALNLCASMGLYQKKVLLIDCDPLGTATRGLSGGTANHPFDLASVLRGKVSLVRAIVDTQIASLDLLPAGPELFSVSFALSRAAANEKILKLLMKDVRNEYDMIVLDAPSSCGMLSIAAMTAADSLLVAMNKKDPWVSDFYGLLKLVKYIRKAHGVDLKIAGISLNRFQQVSGRLEDHVDGCHSGIKDLLYNSLIPDDSTINDASDMKVPIVLYDVNAPAAKAYLRLAREIILSFYEHGLT